MAGRRARQGVDAYTPQQWRRGRAPTGRGASMCPLRSQHSPGPLDAPVRIRLDGHLDSLEAPRTCPASGVERGRVPERPAHLGWMAETEQAMLGLNYEVEGHDRTLSRLSAYTGDVRLARGADGCLTGVRL